MKDDSVLQEEMMLDEEKLDLFFYWIYASVASIFVDLLSHPFGTIWVRQQSYFYHQPSPSVFNIVRELHKEKRFFDGFSINLLSSVPGNLMYLQGRKCAAALFGNDDFGKIMQGPVGIIFGTSVWSPASRLIMLKQASNSQNTRDPINQMKFWGRVNYIYKEGGIRGFYRGILPSVVSHSLADALGSWMRMQILNSVAAEDKKPFSTNVMATAAAFAFFALLFSPLDVVISHLKIQETDRSYFTERKFSGAFKKIIMTKGWRGLFKAAPASMCYGASWHMIIPIEEYIKK